MELFSVIYQTMWCEGALGKYFFASVVFAAVFRLSGAQIEPKIVGGVNVTSMSGFRHQVSLRAKAVDQRRFGDGHLCGGSLINLRTVLTAAHCIHNGKSYYSASNYVIAMGSLYRWVRDNNTLYYSVSRVYGHKNFNPTTFANDIALLTMAEEVPFNHPTAQPIAMAISSPVAGTACTVSGWGTTAFEGGIEPPILMSVNVVVNTRSACNAPTSHNGNVRTGMFCAGPFNGPNLVDSCQGDSGGPLVCQGVLYGIVSNGVGCALPRYPGIYIDVSYYKKWIASGDSSKAGNFVTVVFAALIAAINRKFSVV